MKSLFLWKPQAIHSGQRSLLLYLSSKKLEIVRSLPRDDDENDAISSKTFPYLGVVLAAFFWLLRLASDR